MSTRSGTKDRLTRCWVHIGALSSVALLGLAACGDDSSTASSATDAAADTTASGASAPGSTFSVATVSGLGDVVVDGRGYTVYLLTSGAQKNVPCDDASGCTNAWPDLPLPEGTTAATAGAGLDASLLGTAKSDDGETYPTYGGYLMYEFSGDKGPGQAHGQGLQSFGGTWYALDATGTAITGPAPSGS